MGFSRHFCFSSYRAMVGGLALSCGFLTVIAQTSPGYAATENVKSESVIIDAKSTESKSTDAKPSDAKSSDARPGASRAGDTKSSIMSTNWSSLVLWLATKPSPFQGSDGKYNLVYDLIMTNFSSNPGTLKQLDIVDADSNKVLQSWTGKALEDLLVKKGKPGLEFGACECAPCFINLSFDTKDGVPKKLGHRVLFETVDLDGKPATLAYKSDIAVETIEPVVISPPLKGAGWLAVGGYSSPIGHRRALFPISNHLYSAQTYAIDWCQLDKDDNQIVGDRTLNESAVCYGKPVLAVVDATVAGVLDRFDDQKPDKAEGAERLAYPTGNSVILDLGHGYFATYAHLKRGSIKVKEGDHVTRGQVLGNIGNSGNTTGPHLHFHITKGMGPLDAAAIPYVIDNFEVTGEIPDIEKFMQMPESPKTLKVAPSKYDGKHVLQLPMQSLVVKFAE